MEKYDVAVSLGERCTTTHQLKLMPGVKIGMSPFDYVISPMRGVVDMIERDFHGFCKPSNLGAVKMAKADGGYPVVDYKFGFVFVHEFKVDMPLDDSNVQGKFKYKAGKLREVCLSGQRVLFIRTRVEREEAQAFAAVVTAKYPKLDWGVAGGEPVGPELLDRPRPPCEDAPG